MSIYAMLWEIQVEKEWGSQQFVKVYGQAVPAHIGHPKAGYETDPYAGFLPPINDDYDPDYGGKQTHRAVVIVVEGYNEKEIQQYKTPLMVMTGTEYEDYRFEELLDIIIEKVEDLFSDGRKPIAYSYDADGTRSRHFLVDGKMMVEKDKPWT